MIEPEKMFVGCGLYVWVIIRMEGKRRKKRKREEERKRRTP
jgi:hypothetical protein